MASEEAMDLELDTIFDPSRRLSWPEWTSKNGDDPTELQRRVEVERDGTTQIILARRTVMTDGAGTVTGWVGTVSDVTAEARAEAAVSDARDAALAAHEMQMRFVASASHELRTPTTSILGFVETVLESEDLADHDREFLEIAFRNAQRLSGLIDDLLIDGQSEAASTVMHLEATSLPELIEGVIASIAADAQRGGITIASHCSADPALALVDPLRLEQVVANLLSNAVKFTPNGGSIIIDISRDEAGNRMIVSVTDSGSGIAPDDLDKIFHRFYRTQNALDGLVKGTGLGLAIAKGMVEAQHGTIAVRSEVGHGSTFTVTLPAAEPETAPLAS
jgi:signal transduction histidine kinase